jgi:hypothetical protein
MIRIVVAQLSEGFEVMNSEIAALDILNSAQIREESLDFGSMRNN